MLPGHRHGNRRRSALGNVVVNRIKQLIRTVPDFPRPGIRFRDITPLLVVLVAQSLFS